MKRLLATVLAVAALGATSAACSTSPSSASRGGLRLGYFANVTHATALVGVERGTFAAKVGKLDTQVFNAGPAAVEAIFAGAIDATYIGPNPAINAYVKSKGDAIRIISGATSGGAQLVVKPGIKSANDLRGKTLATPQLGNTQDVALRAWLASNGLKTDPQKGGDVEIAPQENAQTLELFKSGQIAGAWVPEPWASRLVLDGGGEVLLDEKSLWPDGTFVTTHLVVATKFLEDDPITVKRLLEAHVETTDWIVKNPAEAKTVVNAALERLTTKRLAPAVLDRAFANLTVTYDPIATSLVASATHAVEVGLLAKPDLAGIYDLRPLNAVLAEQNRPAVSDAGLGRH
ncbi:MAG TPA: ABC transporter substrate-binding protein [Frankiaceae bacterium]|jgi:NitT/TauT family transport system substrate-binding protein|nr:ABC transporter substrate-binding protein [Frankiaceae bacterium]